MVGPKDLPKLFQDTYKTTLPDHVLQNLALLSPFCSVDYPMPDNPSRAILYRRARGGSGGGYHDHGWVGSAEGCMDHEGVGGNFWSDENVHYLDWEDRKSTRLNSSH